jgi:hypothetical protein
MTPSKGRLRETKIGTPEHWHTCDRTRTMNLSDVRRRRLVLTLIRQCQITLDFIGDEPDGEFELIKSKQEECLLILYDIGEELGVTEERY